MQKIRWWGVLLLLLVAPTAALGQGSGNETRWLNAPGAEQYPGARALILEDDITFELRPDGSTFYSEHDIIKPLTEEGAEEHGQLLRIYDSQTESVQVLRARTIKPDGSVLEVPSDQIVDEPLLEGSQVYAGHRKLSLAFPEATPGSVLEFHLVTYRKPRRDGAWWATTYVQNPDPILHSTFVATLPEGTRLHYATPGLKSAAPRKLKDGSVERYYWDVTNQPPLSPEPSMPPPLQLLHRIEITSFPNWASVGEWFGAGWSPQVEPDSKLGLLVAGILPSGGTSSERLQAVLEWLGSNKETLEFYIDEYTPRPVASLVDEKTLSTLDMAALTAAMLEFAGFQVDPVLAFGEPLPAQAGELPQPNKVQRVLLRVRDAGDVYWVDPEHVGEMLASPPSGFQGSAYLVPGAQKLAELPVAAADLNRQELDVEARVDRSGRMEVGLRLVQYGDSGLPWREAARALAASGRRVREETLDRLFARLAGAFSPRARVHERYFNLQTSPGEPFDLSATLIIPGFVDQEGELHKLTLPVQVNDALRELAGQAEGRRYPIHFSHPFRDETRIHIVLPPESRIVELPPAVHVDTEYASFLSSTRAQGNELWYYSRLVVKKPWVSSEGFAQLVEVSRAATRSQETPVAYQPPPVGEPEGEPDDL